MKNLLIFVAGLLIGANVVYFMRSRSARETAVATVPVASTPTLPAAKIATPPVPPAAAPTAAAPEVDVLPAASTSTTSLLIPVAGIGADQLTDTFNDMRGGGSRRHEALDIMASRGTPVLAASDGKVAKLFTSVPGGLTIYEFDPTTTYAYYYAHLDHYATDLSDGKQLKRGDVIGYVGSTGDASPDAPHLHFAIVQLGPEKKWWKGTSINPYPLLTPMH
jgi:murein DD-endopeptidase MepM/ murein hydrolase activator NlpD